MNPVPAVLSRMLTLNTLLRRLILAGKANPLVRGAISRQGLRLGGRRFPRAAERWPTSLDDRRPEALLVPSADRRRVLVLGVYLAGKPSAIADIHARLGESRDVDVDERWISLGGDPLPGLEGVTVAVVRGRAPTFELANRLLADEDLDRYDYVVLCDDDIICPVRFLDSLIGLQERLGFALAQPARTPDSFSDHPIVEAHRGLAARETLFVECGPVTSFHRSSFGWAFPFDMRSPMGWGYEQVWAAEAKRRGLTLGIIDACPVSHSLRPPVVNYSWHEEKSRQTALLTAREHLTLSESFSVLRAYTRTELVG